MRRRGMSAATRTPDETLRGSHREPSGRLVASLVAVLAWAIVGAAGLAAQDPIEWHGYAQLRYGRSDPVTGFEVRRAKLWLSGPVPDVSHLDFRVQGIFRGSVSDAFVLQDVFVQYGGRHASVRVGQFVPAFSLERSQPDYLLPLIERAAVVETLIPGARTMGRDIGVGGSLVPASGPLHLDMGVFNGSGANRLPGANGDFLATGRVTLSERLGTGPRGTLGGSVAWRRTRGADVGVLSTQGANFAGHGFRWGTDARLVGAGWEIQGEYLHVDLEGEISHGYYVLGSLDLSARNQVAISVEQLSVAGAEVPTGPWYIAGFTHVLGGTTPGMLDGKPTKSAARRPMPTKVMADVRFHVVDGAAKFGAAVQLQVFVH